MDGDGLILYLSILLGVFFIAFGLGFNFRKKEDEELRKIGDVDTLKELIRDDIKQQIKRMTVHDFNTWLYL